MRGHNLDKTQMVNQTYTLIAETK